LRGFPRLRTSFVGRARELSTLLRLLRDAAGQSGHFVTLTGAPGGGKTRLAIEAAMQLTEYGTVENAAFVDLSGLGPGDAPRVLDLVGEAAQSLTGSSLLLVDNLEQVVDAGERIAELLERTPTVCTLATSQRPLGISGEHQFVLPPLAVPSSLADIGDCESVQLFVDRACAVAPEFELNETTAAPVAEICRRLDGLPLAIELAAARVKLLPPHALLSRLEDGLELLSGGARDLPARHRTMRAALTWTYQLLDPEEQHVLRCLSVFVEGFHLSAAEAVVGSRSAWLLDCLQALLDTGLLRIEVVEGDTRYRVLGTVREFAADLLAEGDGEAEAVRQRFADYYLHPGSRRVWPPTRLAPADQQNLRHALESVLVDIVQRSRHTDDLHQQAMALDGVGALAAAQGDFNRARQHYLESARLFGAMSCTASAGIATLHLGQVLARTGERREALRILQQAVAQLRASGEDGLAAAGMVEVGYAELDEQNPESALLRFVEGLRLALSRRELAAVRAGLDGVGRLAAQCGQWLLAVWLWGAASGIARPTLRGPAYLDVPASEAEAARAAMGEDRFAAAWAEGRALGVDQAVQRALAFELNMVPETPRGAGTDLLSPREREVAVLLAQGYTNRAIAEALVITEWTADSHVRHILGKLKLRSRAQVAAWAVERGLVTPSS
jgi:non-specific serine/threonine protein kinase